MVSIHCQPTSKEAFISCLSEVEGCICKVLTFSTLMRFTECFAFEQLRGIWKVLDASLVCILLINRLLWRRRDWTNACWFWQDGLRVLTCRPGVQEGIA